MRGFSWYVRRYLRRHFHAVRLSKSSSANLPNVSPEIPLIVYLNHPSWWDPLTCLQLANAKFSNRKHYAPIEAAMLAKYRVFAKLGFFGVEPGTLRGSATFLRISRAILAQPDTALWITAQGQFSDVRSRPLNLRPGLGHLLGHLDRASVLPLAVEYPFWNERLPEILMHIGEPIDWRQSNAAPAQMSNGAKKDSSSEITRLLETRLASAQDSLAELSRARDASKFETILSGNVGVNAVYDSWRRLKARATGKDFNPAHDPTENQR